MTIDRSELRRLCEAATPGPWRACKDGACDCRMIWSRAADCVVAVGIAAKDEQYTSGEGIVDAKILTANAAFIAAARTAVPALLDALEAAESEAVRLQRAWDSAFNQAMENGQRAANAEAREKRLRELLLKASNYVELTYSEEAGEDVAEAKRDLDEINAAIAEAAP